MERPAALVSTRATASTYLSRGRVHRSSIGPQQRGDVLERETADDGVAHEAQLERPSRCRGRRRIRDLDLADDRSNHPLHPPPNRPLLKPEFSRRFGLPHAFRDAGADVVDDFRSNVFIELSPARGVPPRPLQPSS